MKGLTYFATKQDVLNSLKLYPERTKAKLKSLYEDRYVWVATNELPEREAGIIDEFHIVTENNSNGKEREEQTYTQMEKQVDKNSRIYKLGFTEEEILELIKDM